MATNEERPVKPGYEIMAIRAKDQFISVVGEETWNKEAVFALQIMRGNAEAWGKVYQDNPQSIQNAVVNVALCGTTLNPARQQAFLIPRRVNNKMTACLDHSYRGLCNIATSSGGVIDMDADCVYENDYFHYVRGLNPVLEHIPFDMRDNLTEPDIQKGRGAFKCVYATALIPYGNGIHKKFIVLTKEDVDKVRKSSQAPNSPMWSNWYEEGARKTAIKKLYKLLPQSDRMSTAISALNEFEGLPPEETPKERVRNRYKIDEPIDPVIEAQPAGDGETPMTPEEEAEIRRQELAEHGTDEEKGQEGLFS